MPLDIYGQTQNATTTQTVSSHEMKLSIEDGGDLGSSLAAALIQTVQLQYSQPIRTVREIGSRNYYYSDSNTTGTLTIGRIIAEAATADVKSFFNNNENILRVPPPGESNPTITIQNTFGNVMPTTPGATANANLQSSVLPLVYTLHQCIVTNIGAVAEVSGQFVRENLQIKFNGLQIAPDTP